MLILYTLTFPIILFNYQYLSLAIQASYSQGRVAASLTSTVMDIVTEHTAGELYSKCSLYIYLLLSVYQKSIKFLLQIPPLSISKPYNIPFFNPFPNNPATPTMVTIIIANYIIFPSPRLCKN